MRPQFSVFGTDVLNAARVAACISLGSTEGYDNLTGFYNHARKKLTHPLIVPGISDAGAHLNIFQDGSTPTSMVSFWSRDRVKGPQIPLEISVMKQARDTAWLYGLYDRGTLEVGKKADLVSAQSKARFHSCSH